MTNSSGSVLRSSMADAVARAYSASQDDEKIEPIVRVDRLGRPVGRIRNGDYVIFYDIRGEREIELTEAFTAPDFSRFPTRPDTNSYWATMIQYYPKLDVRVAFPPPGQIEDTLSEVISAAGMRQVKITESEKATHVTFFFNGKRKQPFPGEEWVTVPSPHGVLDLSTTPKLSVSGVTDAALKALRDPGYDLVVTNLANVDVIGHIENPGAIRTAVETVDHHIGMIIEAALQERVTVLLTADHGTVEHWYYPDGTIDTGHTDSPVPFILLDSDPDGIASVLLRDSGELGDVAPTILELLGLHTPPAMTGRSLLSDLSEEWLVKRRRVLLLIADGWGLGDGGPGDLIAQAETPVMDRLSRDYPFTQLQAAGNAVGMPKSSVGNSEAGHLHLGAGRRILSDRLRIDAAIEDGTFYSNPAFLWAVRGAIRDGTRLHLLGLVSFYSSHGSVDHLLALLKLAKQERVPEVFVHSMLGRRGERKDSGAKYIRLIEEQTAEIGIGRVASVIGRFWSLDREGNWDRIEKTYRMLVDGVGTAVSPD